jgi:hypothetical protein
MRIVYDYNGPTTRLPINPIAPVHGDRETVMVVRLDREGSDGRPLDPRARRLTGADVAEARSGTPADRLPGAVKWKTSGEALERDRHVRGHENAHLSALGPYAASGILYSTVNGADGEAIAVGGRIAVDLAVVPGDPEATLRKARTVLNASQAPGDPSAADMRVAARAYRLMQEARQELAVERFA